MDEQKKSVYKRVYKMLYGEKESFLCDCVFKPSGACKGHHRCPTVGAQSAPYP